MSLTVHRALASESRARLLDVLRGRAAPAPVDELAAAVGLHVNTVREHLDHLVAADLVARRTEDRVTRGRPRVLYSARGDGDGDGADHGPGREAAREQLLHVLLAAFGRGGPAGALAEAAGRACAGADPDGASADAVPDPARGATAAGSADAQVAALLAHLHDAGFDPDVEPDVDPDVDPAPAPGPLAVRLRRCPVRDLADDRADVVCGAHLGLARGAVARVPGPLVVDRLERGDAGTAKPCVLHLRAVTPEPAA